MNYTFCTLFDKNYLYKGLALYQSLSANCDEFMLWILCMDSVTYAILEKMQLRNVELISLDKFEDDTLRKVRVERTNAEYCWTCTSPLILYVMRRIPLGEYVAYLDADLFFFSDPKPIYNEFSINSILIIGHRFSPEYIALEKTSGIYNVGMMIFRNDPSGVECLNWWRDQCLKACSLDPEAGVCGDQKYLDDWPSRFKNVVVLQHKGGGLAPWNIANYRLKKCGEWIYVDNDELIFYHFHSLKIWEKTILNKHPVIAASGYEFEKSHLSLIYRPYIDELHRAINKVACVNPKFSFGYEKLNFHELIHELKKKNLLLIRPYL